MPDPRLMNDHDLSREREMKARADDWRNGNIVYQVFVDRFAPSGSLEKKRKLYAAPRRLRDWNELPRKGTYNEQAQVWGHEIDFWGGDLESLATKLDYLQELGIDVLYLNPIFESFTNHKYDASDYNKVDPAYGTRENLAVLSKALHARGMKLVLDGVFNHMGRKSPMFQDALKNPKSPWHNFFRIGREFRQGYVGWMDVANLPELNLENPAVQDYIFRKPDSVVQSYLQREEIDGWRLDVAFDIGFGILDALTRSAHAAKSGSLVVGEIWNYPEEWHPAVDGVMNMHGRSILLHLLQGKLSGPIAGSMWESMIADSGYDHILKTWLVLDNHDTPRLPYILKEAWQQRMARVLQFTLPGSVCLYYGSELGMDGGEDPEQRAPMRWDLVRDDNPTLQLHKSLLKIRREEPALRYGDFRKLHSEKLFAFLRRTLSARETIVVLANPTNRPVTECLQLRESKFNDVTQLKNLLGGESFTVFAGTIDVTLPPYEVMVLKPQTSPYPGGYDRYDRMN
ncbi:MAG: glycoside hydrolase family 13 protein [Candidatus Ozemobacteraceae bacterium]